MLPKRQESTDLDAQGWQNNANSISCKTRFIIQYFNFVNSITWIVSNLMRVVYDFSHAYPACGTYTLGISLLPQPSKGGIFHISSDIYWISTRLSVFLLQ